MNAQRVISDLRGWRRGPEPPTARSAPRALLRTTREWFRGKVAGSITIDTTPAITGSRCRGGEVVIVDHLDSVPNGGWPTAASA
jgi:hypothetical protein